MQPLNFRRIFAFAGVLSLALYFGLYWINLINDPDERTGSDFIGFYNFGRILPEKGIAAIYEIDEQERIEEEVVGHPVKVIFYTHLPFIAPLAAVVVDENYVASFQRWALIMLFLNILNVAILASVVDLKRFARENSWILLLGAFFFDPTASGFMNGQDTALLLLGVAVWFAGLIAGKHFIAGLGLSLVTVRPQIALFLAVPFLFKQRKVFWGFVLGGAILAGVSVWMLGLTGTIKFVESLRYIESTIWVEPHSFDMPTISGIVRRNINITNLSLTKSFIWACYLLGIAGFSFWWYRTALISEKHIGLITLCAVFLLPYAHYHELTLLLIPIFCVIRVLSQNQQMDSYYLAVLPLAVSWLSALGYAGSGVLRFPIMYSVMIALGFILLRAEQATRRNERQPVN